MRGSSRRLGGLTVSAISAIGLAAILLWMVIIPADIVAVLVVFAAAAIFQAVVIIALLLPNAQTRNRQRQSDFSGS
jgi:hypothetical protein